MILSRYHKNDSDFCKGVADFLCPLGFIREYTIIWDKAGSRYRVDFAHSKMKVVVEVDDRGHRTTTGQAMDAKRDSTLASLGWFVVRVVTEPLPIETLIATAYVAPGQPFTVWSRRRAVARHAQFMGRLRTYISLNC